MGVILSHTDFDGVVSASLLSIATNIDFIRFISNKQIWLENLTGQEVISDLPCPWKCKLWFDHHESNLTEMKERGIDIKQIPGKFQIADSCAKIIYDYYKNNVNFPSYFDHLVQETNKIDAMKYTSMNDWLEENPVKILSSTVQLLNDDDYRKFIHYLLEIAKLLKKKSPEELIEHEPIKRRYTKFKNFKEESINLIKKIYYFHKNDIHKSIAILDLSEFKTAPRLDKNFIYIVEPNTDAVLLINSIFKNNTKTNDLKFSIGINFIKSHELLNINVAKIFEELDIGGGHSNTAGGLISTETKQDNLDQKEFIITEIIKKWDQQKTT